MSLPPGRPKEGEVPLGGLVWSAGEHPSVGMFALCAALLLGGCMVGPDYQRPAVPVPAAYPGAATESGPVAAARMDWWTQFNDSQLTEVVTLALANNTDVRRAVARIEEADANLRAVGATLYPEVDLGGAAARSRSSLAVALPAPAGANIHNDLLLRFSASFEIDFWGKLRRGVEAARAQALVRAMRRKW